MSRRVQTYIILALYFTAGIIVGYGASRIGRGEYRDNRVIVDIVKNNGEILIYEHDSGQLIFEYSKDEDLDKSGITIEGESVGDSWNLNTNTVLIFGANITMFRIGDPAYSQEIRSVTFRDFAVLGSGPYVEGGSRGSGVFAFHRCSDIKLERILFQYCGGNVVSFDRAQISTLQDCWFYQCGSTNKATVNFTSTSGVNTQAKIDHCTFATSVYTDILVSDSDICNILYSHFEGNATNPTAYHIRAVSGISVKGCYIGNGPDTCDFISLYNIWGSWILDNLIIYAGRDGIAVTGDSQSIKISRNIILSVGRYGIQLGPVVFDNTVSENRVYNCSWAGIILSSADNCTIASNHVFDNDQSGSGLHGIWLYNSDFNIVYGNHCYDIDGTQDWGIYESGTSDYNTITSCHAFDNVVGGISVSGANTHVNLCWNDTDWIA